MVWMQRSRTCGQAANVLLRNQLFANTITANAVFQIYSSCCERHVKFGLNKLSSGKAVLSMQEMQRIFPEKLRRIDGRSFHIRLFSIPPLTANNCRMLKTQCIRCSVSE